LFFAWLLCLVLIPVDRYLVRQLFIHFNLWGEPVVLVGAPEKLRILAKHFRIHRQYGLRIKLAFCDTNYPDKANTTPYPMASPAEVGEAARRLNLHTVLVIVEDLNHIDALVDRYRYIFQRVILIKDQTGKYGLNTLTPWIFQRFSGCRSRISCSTPRGRFSNVFSMC